MKSFLKILLLSLLILNCSEDDSLNNNSVIGDWILVNSTIGDEIDLNDCNSKSTLKFTNNEFESTFFNLLDSVECRPQTSKAS